MTSTSFLEDDTPFEYSDTSQIGDSIRLKMDVCDIEHGIGFSKNDIELNIRLLWLPMVAACCFLII